MKYKIWNKQDSLVTPIGEVLTAEEVMNRYPASRIEDSKWIICDSFHSLGVFMEFTQTKEAYKALGVEITDDMTDQEVLDAISYFEENPPTPEPSAEERIAAAMEYQNLFI